MAVVLSRVCTARRNASLRYPDADDDPFGEFDVGELDDNEQDVGGKPDKEALPQPTPTANPTSRPGNICRPLYCVRECLARRPLYSSRVPRR